MPGKVGAPEGSRKTALLQRFEAGAGGRRQHKVKFGLGCLLLVVPAAPV